MIGLFFVVFTLVDLDPPVGYTWQVTYVTAVWPVMGVFVVVDLELFDQGWVNIVAGFPGVV